MKSAGFIMLDTLVSLSIATSTLLSVSATMTVCNRSLNRLLAADQALAEALTSLDQVPTVSSGNPTIVSVSIRESELQRVVLQ